MMAIELKRKKKTNFQKQIRRKEIMDNVLDVVNFFERIFLLVRFAISKTLSLLTIPFWIIGIIGAYNCYKVITDSINNSILFIHSSYFKQMYNFLGIYLIYTFVKMALECSLEIRK